jgi:outer membrane protein OmpA-like peptidoglycan-associated protein
MISARGALASATVIVALLGFTMSAPAQPPSGEGRGKVLDLSGRAVDLVSRVEDLTGKTRDVQVKETATEVRMELAADVLFDFDKADILPKAQAALKQVAAVIRDKAKGKGAVTIEGHTDAKGSDSYNQRLSKRRAEAVKNWLVNHEGLGNVSFTTRGFGATKPVSPNKKPDGSDDPEGRQKNRRVEIVVKK